MAHSILIAVDLADGRRWIRERTTLNPRDVTIVTPRSIDRARGVTADDVLFTAAGAVLSVGDLKRIREAIAPALVTR